MLWTVDHTTRYTYDGPVGYALQQLRLTPKDRPGQQQVRDWTIAVEGGEAQLHYSDHLGNGVDLIAVAGGARADGVPRRGRGFRRPGPGGAAPDSGGG